MNRSTIALALALVGTAAAAPAAEIVVAGTPGTTGATALYLTLPSEVSTNDATATPAEIATWLGRPDDAHTGVGSQSVTYDFGTYRIVNGAGQDLNIYETDFGGNEYSLADFLVSADGVNFFSIDATLAPALNLAGDEVHSSSTFRQSFDVGGAVAASGANQFRYLRVQGLSGGAVSGNAGFDLEAVGVANFVQVNAVPEPTTWAMMIAGFGLVGAASRRRQRTTATYA